MKCDLCGLPLARLKVQHAVGDKIFRFCCPGCRQVFLILSTNPEGMPANFRETELYKACLESGIIPREEEDGSSREPPQDSPNPESSPPPLSLAIKVDGMWCPACSWLIEEVLRRTKGVLEPRVFFLSDLVQVKYFPHILSPQEIMTRISTLGYRPSLFQEGEALDAGKEGPAITPGRLLHPGHECNDDFPCPLCRLFPGSIPDRDRIFLLSSLADDDAGDFLWGSPDPPEGLCGAAIWPALQWTP